MLKEGFGGIGCIVCLLSSITELDDTALVVSKNTFKKTQQQCPLPEIMTGIFKIIHRPFGEQFITAQKEAYILSRLRGYLTKLSHVTAWRQRPP